MLDHGLIVANDVGESDAVEARAKALHVALVGNFPPRRCGIATFTSDVYEALTTADQRVTCDVIAMTDEGGVYDYPAAVIQQIRQNELADYVSAAKAINASGADLLCLQHEYGIFGGPSGEDVLTLIYNVKCPVVTTLHTVLQEPTDGQRRVLSGIIARSAKLIVMAEKGREILRRVYDAPDHKIAVVPHGAPDMPFGESDPFKAALGFAGKEVILTFGLLSPNKGIEAMIRAVPAIKVVRPDATYVILGATHPHLIAHEGEAYRERLVALASDLGVADSVRFVNAYVDQETLLSYLSAADVYVSPYLNEAQITSGTLSYAVALGKPVISTPYWHAKELLADGNGALVDFNDSHGFASAAISLLSNPDHRNQVRENAYAVGREMIWPRFAARYLAIFSGVRMQSTKRAPSPRQMPLPMLGGVARMTDNCGMLQHSSYGVADRAHGYCVDDNARGLILTNRYEASGRTLGQYERLAESYAAFVHHAWNEERGRFRNFMSYDRRWLEEEGSDDSFGRSFWSIGVTAELSARADLKVWAESLAVRVLPHVGAITAPRARAFFCLGLVSLLEARPDWEKARALLDQFASSIADGLKTHRTPDWVWPEPYLAYDNARFPEALMRAGIMLGRDDLIDAGLETLISLTAIQRTPHGLFRPVGVAGMGKQLGLAAAFDQQPVEAAATIDACAAAFDATGDIRWMHEARRAFDWFLGANDLGAPLADPARGLCYDGLTPERVNLNQGAESILSFQMATCAMHTLARAARLGGARAVHL